jgi:hypothetical protein
MSTKAISKALRDMACDYNPCLPGMCRKHDAVAEVEAIRKAAKALRSLSPTNRETGLALGLMDNIAEES